MRQWIIKIETEGLQVGKDSFQKTVVVTNGEKNGLKQIDGKVSEKVEYYWLKLLIARYTTTKNFATWEEYNKKQIEIKWKLKETKRFVDKKMWWEYMISNFK